MKQNTKKAATTVLCHWKSA